MLSDDNVSMSDGHRNVEWFGLQMVKSLSSGVTPIGQDWTNAMGLWGLGCTKPDPKHFFVYFNIEITVIY